MAESALGAGSLQQGPKRRETRKPVKSVNGSKGWCRARNTPERCPHLFCCKAVKEKSSANC